MTFQLAGAEQSVLEVVVSSWGVNAPTCLMCGRTHGRTRGQVRTLGVSGQFAEVVCALGATLPRTSTSQPLNGGNCTNRGATRRRRAGRMLLMVQNPHRQPDIHPGARGGGSESTGARRDTGLTTAPAGGGEAWPQKSRMQFDWMKFQSSLKTLQFQRFDFKI